MTSTWYKSRSRYTNRKYDDASKAQASPPPPLGNLVQTIEISDLDMNLNSKIASPSIRDCRLITSYNWLEGKEAAPTILVPGKSAVIRASEMLLTECLFLTIGKPPLWAPVASPSRLNEDNGTYFRDKNAARFPKHPLEPCVIAAMEADNNISPEVDIVACGSTLGNLLRFVRRQDKPFRILVEKIHNTVFFTRRENTPTEIIPGVRGYGHSFPEANTIWEPDVKGSASHQRIVRYTFGGHRILVRFEADGYIKPHAQGPSSVNSTSSTTVKDQTSLADLLSEADMGLASQTTATLAESTINVKFGGELIPQAQVFDLKTRSIYTKDKKDHLAEELPRLWVSQTPTFILAFHTQGLFKKADIQIKDVREDVQRWELDHQAELAQLKSLIDMIIEVVSDMPDQKMELRYAGIGGLEVRERLADVNDALSDAVKARWGLQGGALTDESDDGVGEPETQGSDHDSFDPETDVNEDDSDEDHRYSHDNLYGYDYEEELPDYTACSADECGYCGKCPY
ncbi:uncharacterized protein PODANS_3_10420 [Podospora anserina S mat+]|uniref:Podospora anserina S mat+ genomic DNA chromosome 3, supercontig 2 n=1 Tax=Podospora anserina (strain S / ATCC MYA-4624 / DSM 980 / FGSC 10383) TaxID=515849 RepID=B2B1L1_PODAN|nr:uncharacterized protein PODANS_3_10420 [Podospora anserina S mat+]CAP70996.1 unnamed protein product [Podospora anserina S mat+]CDP27591.1 Putative protein of unknown function [Podospora anserina S mat+]